VLISTSLYLCFFFVLLFIFISLHSLVAIVFCWVTLAYPNFLGTKGFIIVAIFFFTLKPFNLCNCFRVIISYAFKVDIVSSSLLQNNLDELFMLMHFLEGETVRFADLRMLPPTIFMLSSLW
jgi:hypothetical protein